MYRFKCEWTNCELCGRTIQKESNKHFDLYLCNHCKNICYNKKEIIEFIKGGFKK
jgi:hypothetical protein